MEYKYDSSKVSREKSGFLACIVNARASSYMDSCKSGYIVKEKSVKLLKHEQGHFDISEIWARKLNKKLQGLCGRGKTVKDATDDLQKQVQKAYDESERDRDKMEKDYDKETKGGTDDAKQAEWDKMISDLLKQR